MNDFNQRRRMGRCLLKDCLRFHDLCDGVARQLDAHIEFLQWAVEHDPAPAETLLPLSGEAADQVYAHIFVAGAARDIPFFETDEMREWLRTLRPDRFDDLVALLAMDRPGPIHLGMVDEFIRRRRAPDTPWRSEAPPVLVERLEATCGMILYHEQVMRIAQDVAGYSAEDANRLRKTLGAGNIDVIAREREVFLQAATAQGLSASEAAGCFDFLEQFACYAFPKSHAVGRALLAFQTAWLQWRLQKGDA